MLNPDGVINGYYRTWSAIVHASYSSRVVVMSPPILLVSLSGHDMNRCWMDPDPIQHAPVAKLKELLAQGQAAQGVELFCDVHGHVRGLVVAISFQPWDCLIIRCIFLAAVT
jgi:hypothetical protein